MVQCGVKLVRADAHTDLLSVVDGHGHAPTSVNFSSSSMPELIIRPEMLSHIEILRQQPQVLSTDPVLLLPLRSRFDDLVGHP